ncbi:MAG: DUF1461 domain-containing protein [Methyloligellaceae bacterium]
MRLLAIPLLFAFSLILAACALYTSTAFELLGLHPLALEVVNGSMTAGELKAFELNGLSFTERETRHLLDVKGVVASARTVLPVLAVALVLLLGARRDLIRPAASGALILLFAAFAALTAALLWFGPATTFDALHRIVFEPGSYVFDNRSLMANLYGNAIVLRGVAFVLCLTLAFLSAVWAAARLLSRHGLLQAERPRRTPTSAAGDRTPDP